MEDIEFTDDAVEFILKRLTNEQKANVTADDVDYLVDLIYDYYADQGLFNDKIEEEVEINEQEMFNYVSDRVEEDGLSEKLTAEIIAEVLDGEYEYGKKLNIY